MTTQQILDIARAKLLEEGTDILTDARLLTYANFTKNDIVKKVFPNSSILTATVTFTAGVGTLPADFGTLYTDVVDANYNVFQEVSIADFARNSSGNAVTVEGGALKVFPKTTASLPIKYYPTFADLNTSSVNPLTDSYFDECYIYGVIYRAYEDLQDQELSAFFENKYDKLIKQKSETLSNYEENAQKGGVLFNGINIIGGGSNYNDPNRWY